MVLLAGNSLRLVPAALQCLYRDSNRSALSLRACTARRLHRWRGMATRGAGRAPSTVRTHATGASGSDVGRGHGVADA